LPPTSTAGLVQTPTARPAPTATGQAPQRPPPPSAYSFQEFDLDPGTHPHDVAPGPDGRVWYTGQATGGLGWLDPSTGGYEEIGLGAGSAPHGVIIGPDNGAWVTDGGLNAIVRVDTARLDVKTYPLPADRPNVGLNTAAFDGDGTLWFTGQAGGVYGRWNDATGGYDIDVFDAPRGPGPYGIDGTPAGEVWFGSLAGSYLARIDSESNQVTVHDPPTPGAGARRTWSDSQGRLWISEWFAGNVGRYDPAKDEWREWRLSGTIPQPYAVYVDELDLVWLTDFGSNSLVRFDPATETFDSFTFPTGGAEVRQLLGRPGEIWGAESGTDKLVVLRW